MRGFANQLDSYVNVSNFIFLQIHSTTAIFIFPFTLLSTDLIFPCLFYLQLSLFPFLSIFHDTEYFFPLLFSSINQVLLYLSFQWLFSPCCCHLCSSLLFCHCSSLTTSFLSSSHNCHPCPPLFFLQIPLPSSFPLLTIAIPVLLYFSLKLLMPHLFFHLLFPSIYIFVLSFLVIVPSSLFLLILFQWPSLLFFFSFELLPSDIFVSLLLLWLYILLTFCGLFINLQILNS